MPKVLKFGSEWLFRSIKPTGHGAPVPSHCFPHSVEAVNTGSVYDQRGPFPAWQGCEGLVSYVTIVTCAQTLRLLHAPTPQPTPLIQYSLVTRSVDILEGLCLSSYLTIWAKQTWRNHWALHMKELNISHETRFRRHSFAPPDQQFDVCHRSRNKGTLYTL